MTELPSAKDFDAIQKGYDQNPSRSLSLRKEAYVEDNWHNVDLAAIISKTWQWVCHVEKVPEPGAYMTIEIAGKPIAVVRDKQGDLRAFYSRPVSQ